MNFAQLTEIVEKQKSGTSFYLMASDFSSPSITTLFRNFSDDSKFSFDQATLSIDDAKEIIELEGLLEEQFLGEKNLKVKAEFTIVEENAEVLFTFSGFPENWRLSDLLPDTQNTVADEFTYFLPSFQLDSQARNRLEENFQVQLGYPEDPPTTGFELKNGLSFDSQLVRKDLPSQLLYFFASTEDSRLKIGGPVMIKFDQPAFWFTSEPSTFLLMGQSIPVSLEMISVTVDQAEARGAFTPQYFGRVLSTFSIPIQGAAPLEIPLSARFLHADFSTLLIESDLSEASALGFEALSGLIGGGSGNSLIPDFFPSLDQVRLEKVGFAFQLEQKHLMSLWLTIAFDQEWKLFDGAFRVYQMKVLFDVTDPTSSRLKVGMTVLGNLGLGGVDLSTRINLNAAAFTAKLIEGETIPLSDWLDSILGMSLDMPEIVGTDFYLSGNLTKNAYDFSTTLESDWTIGLEGGELAIQKLSLAAGYQGRTQTQPSQISGRVYGEILIGTSQLFLSAEYNSSDKSWDFSGGTLGDSEISLTGLANELAKLFNTSLPNAVPQVTLKNLSVTFNSKSKSFGFIGEMTVPGKIPLANCEFELQTRVNLQSFVDPKTKKRKLTGRVEAFLEVAGDEWMVQYELAPQAEMVEARWRSTDGSSVGLEDILDVLGLEQMSLPDGMDVSLVQVELLYDVSKQFATLSAKSNDGTDAYLTAGKSEGKWAFVFGVNFNLQGGKLSSLPGIGSSLKLADFLSVNLAGIMVASAEIKGYQPPALPSLPTVDSGGSTVMVPVQPINANSQLNVTRGFSVMADIDLAAQGSGDGVLGQVLSVIPDLRLLFQVTYSPTEAAYYAALSGNVNLPTNKDVILSINTAAVRFRQTLLGSVYQVMGSFRFNMFGESLTATLSAIFEPNGTALAATIEADEDGLPGPPGLKGFHLYQLGLLMGMEVTPPSLTIAMQGKYQIGVGKSALNEVGLAFQIIEKVPNPLYLSFYMEEAGFDELITLVTDKPASGILKSLQAVQGYDLSFYWANQQVVLPDGSVALPGFGFGGMITIFGFGAFGEFVMITGQGIKGSAQLSPIDLGGVLKVAGNGPGIKRLYEKVNDDWKLVDNVKATKSLEGGNYKEQVIVKPGGPIIAFNALGDPMFLMSWDITLFDVVGQKVDVTISSKGITFTLTYKISNALLLAIECELQSWTAFSAHAEFIMDLNFTIPSFKVFGVQVGNLKINSSLDAELKIALNPQQFLLEIDGDFDFQGTSLDLPKITLNASPSDLQKLPEWIVAQIQGNAENIFKDVFNMADDLAKMIEMGIVTGVDNVAGVFKDAYQVGAQKAAELVKMAGGTAEDALDAISDVYDLGADELANIGENLGMGASAVGDFLKNTGGYTDEVVSAALQGAGYSVEQVWDYMKQAYGWFQHVDVKHVDQNAVQWHGDVSKRLHQDKRKHIDVRVKRWRKHVDVGRTIGINNKQTLTPHVDVPHVDLEPTPDKPHIDQKGVSIPKNRYGGAQLTSQHFDVSVGYRKFGKHFDLAHMDQKLKLSVPKAPPNHIDVGHVDVGSDLDKKS